MPLPGRRSKVRRDSALAVSVILPPSYIDGLEILRLRLLGACNASEDAPIVALCMQRFLKNYCFLKDGKSDLLLGTLLSERRCCLEAGSLARGRDVEVIEPVDRPSIGSAPLAQVLLLAAPRPAAKRITRGRWPTPRRSSISTVGNQNIRSRTLRSGRCCVAARHSG